MAQVMNGAGRVEFMCARWPAAGWNASSAGLSRVPSAGLALGPAPELAVRAAGSAALRPSAGPCSSQLRVHTAAAHSPPAAVNFAAGLLAGIAVDVPLHPLDTVKTRLQAPEGLNSGGFRGLWGGLTPVLLRSVPCSALFFVSYEYVRHCFEMQAPSAHSLPLWCDAVAGAAANTVACAVRVPCEVLKQQMQAQAAGASQGLVATARRVGAAGLGGFYRGLGATLHRELAFAVVQMPLFEYLKQLHPWNGDSSRSKQGAVGMTCGGVAGAVAGAVTTPLDVAKTQIMLSSHHSERHGISKALANIYAAGGVRALLSGALPRTAYVGASCALSFGAFEWSRSLLWAPGGP